MNLIAKNFKKLRALKGLTQFAFADHLGITRASVSAYEEGRASPKNDLLIKIASEFKLSVEDLLTKELTVNELLGFSPKDQGSSNQQSFSIPYVRLEERESFSKAKSIKAIRDELPLISLPFPPKGAGMAFELKPGLEFKGSGIQISIARRLTASKWKEALKSVCLLQHKNSWSYGVLSEQGSNYMLERDETQVDIPKTQVKELWQELGKLQFYESPQSPQGKMKDIESRLKEIEALLQKEKS